MEEGTRWDKRYDIPALLIFFVAILALKWTTLSVPYYWDESIWVSGAYWLSGEHLFRVIHGLHPADVFDYHPPILHFSAAFLFKLFGGTSSVSHLLIVCISFLGVYFTYLLGSFLYGRLTGILSAALLLLSPIYFAQSGMFLGDLPVAAFGVLCTYFAFRRFYIPYLICGIYLVLIKETSIAIIFSILGYLYMSEKKPWKELFKTLLKYAAPLGVFICFVVLQKITTGRFSNLDAWSDRKRMFIPEWDSIRISAFLITKWLFFSQARIFFSLIVILNLVIHKTSRWRTEHSIFLFLLCASGYIYSFIQFLPRYLLPILPFFCILTAWSLSCVIPSIKIRTVVALGLCILLVHSFEDRQIIGTSEWNMQYLEVVERHKNMCARIEREFPTSRIVTSWPYRAQLSLPYLGYVQKPLTVVDFMRANGMNASDVIYWSEPPTKNSDRIRQYILSHDLPAIGKIETWRVKAGLFAAVKP